MLKANFIADPHEWMPRDGVTHLDAAWLANYSQFKGRLNWLLLWNDEVQIMDSFVLFNRQVERWIDSARNERSGREALEHLFGTRSLRVALRTGDGNQTFNTLQDIDDAHMRGNPDFRWYFDGPPRKEFPKLLDNYLGLPSESYSVRYKGEIFGPRMKSWFDAAFERTSGRESIYEAYADLREAMPIDAPDRLRSMIDGEWRRSTFYTILGFGIDQHGKLLPARRELEDFSEPVRMKFRHLVDSVWHRTIDQNLGIPAKYPGAPPPIALFEAWELSEASFRPADSNAEWLNDALLDKTVGAAHIDGDVDQLFRRIASLDIAQVCRLRDHSIFREYRQKYSDFESQRVRASSDVALLNDIAELVVKCLKQTGQVVGVKIEERGTGVTAIRYLSRTVMPKLVGHGLAYVVRRPMVRVGLEVLGVEQGIKWLTMRFQRVGIPSRPLQLKATCVGPIRSRD